MTIVDSPGIGESEEITNLVMEYMPKAFGFIYVINSTNAGGVQADRVSTWFYLQSSPGHNTLNISQ